MSDLEPILPAGTGRVQVGNRGAWLDPTEIVALEPERTDYSVFVWQIVAVLRSGARVVVEDHIDDEDRDLKERVAGIAQTLWNPRPPRRVRTENH